MAAERFSTKVTELLERESIPYRLLPHRTPAFTCEEAARERSVPLGEMVKCLVFIDKATGRPLLACVPASKRVSLSKLKKLANVKSFNPAGAEQIREATGFEQGAIAPVALPSDLSAVADSAILKHEKVNISSGSPTAGIELRAWDLRRIFRGRFASIAE